MPEGFTTDNLEKQDVLHLLEVGLKENQPFARHFADTVLREIGSKVRDLDIQTSAIKIDGDAISEEINNQIKEGVGKDVDNTVKQTKERIAGVSKEASKTSSGPSPLSIQSLLGQTPEMSMLTRVKYQGFTRDLMDRIQKGMPDNFDFKEIGVSDFFRPPSGSGVTGFLSSSIKRFKKWDKFQIDLLDKITGSLEGTKFEFKQIGIGDIFRPPSDSGISNFLGSSIGRYRKWNKLQNTLLDKITDSLKGGVEFEGGVTLNDIMGLTPGMGMLNKMRWKRLQHKVISNIEKAIKDTSKLVPNVGNITPDVGGKRQKKTSQFKTLEEKMPSVIVNKFDNEAMKQLMSLGPHGASEKGYVEKDKKSPGWLTKLALAGAAILGGAIGVGIAALLSDGPLKGVGKLISRIGIKLGTTMLKWFGRFLPKWMLTVFKSLQKGLSKTIPNALRRIALSIKPVMERALKGFKTGFGKLIAKAGKMFVGVTGKMWSFLKAGMSDSVLAFGKKITGSLSGVFRSLTSKASKGVLQLGKSGLLKKAFGGIGKLFGKVFGKSALKKLPFGLGALFGLAFGVSRIKNGDIFGGMVEFLSGIASIVPGIGTAVSIALDVFLAVRDMKMTKEEKIKPTGDSFFSIFQRDMMERVKKALPYMPVIGTIIRFKEAKELFAQGDWMGGLLAAGGALATLVPGLGPILSAGVDMLSGMLQDKQEQQELKTGGTKTKSIFQAFKDIVYEKIRKGIKNLPPWLKRVMKHIPGVAALIGSVSDEDLDTGESFDDGPQLNMPKSKRQQSREREAGLMSGTDEPPAWDFIWRKGQPIQKFNKGDNILSVKDDDAFKKLTDYMDGAKKGEPGDSPAMTQLVMKMDDVVKLLGALLMKEPAEVNRNPEAAKSMGEMSSMGEDQGGVRDPAYILRSRAWDRLRKGYVVI